MATFRIQKDKDNPYTVMGNFHLRDHRISWQAKGLLSYLLHLPNDWKITVDDLRKRSKNGRSATESSLKELIKYKYIKKSERKQLKDRNGKFLPHDYDVYEKPFTGYASST